MYSFIAVSPPKILNDQDTLRHHKPCVSFLHIQIMAQYLHNLMQLSFHLIVRIVFN